MNYVIIIVLAVFFPGLGNIYVKDYKNGSVYFLLLPLIVIVFLQYLCFSFTYYLILWILVISLRLISLIHPLYLLSRNKTTIKKRYGIILILSFGIVSLMIPSNSVSELFRYRTNKINSKSMMTTLTPGDRIVCDYQYFKTKKLKNGDIFVFRENGNQFISRCIAQDGDTISIKNGVVFVNNIQINEPYIFNDQNIFSDQNAIPEVLTTLKEVTVEKGMIFIIGDNRYNSKDSRFGRIISKKDVLGKPLYFYFSSELRKIGQKIK